MSIDFDFKTIDVSSAIGDIETYCNLQIVRLRQLKNELERKAKDQEEELDEQAGTIQQLEQV